VRNEAACPSPDWQLANDRAWRGSLHSARYGTQTTHNQTFGSVAELPESGRSFMFWSSADPGRERSVAVLQMIAGKQTSNGVAVSREVYCTAGARTARRSTSA
jgi:hypothetical protein